MDKQKIMRFLAKISAFILTITYFDTVWAQFKDDWGKFGHPLDLASLLLFLGLLFIWFWLYGLPAIPLYYYGFKKKD